MAPITQTSKTTVEFGTSTTINANSGLEIHSSNDDIMEVTTASNTIIKIGPSNDIVEIDNSKARASDDNYISTVEVISSKMGENSMNTVINIDSSDRIKVDNNSEIYETLGTTIYWYLFGIVLFVIFIYFRSLWCGSSRGKEKTEMVGGNFERGDGSGDCEDDIERGELKKKRSRTLDNVEAPLLLK